MRSSSAALNHASVEVNDGSGMTVALVRLFVPKYLGEAEANARLIAAAPELVEALRGFVESALYDPTMDGRGAFKGWAQSDLKRAEVTARALLAKIDG
jgi:hypothetical protein